MDYEVEVTIWTDSTAGKSVASRTGLGEMRHVELDSRHCAGGKVESEEGGGGKKDRGPSHESQESIGDGEGVEPGWREPEEEE